jgi:hypothetical protein
MNVISGGVRAVPVVTAPCGCLVLDDEWCRTCGGCGPRGDEWAGCCTCDRAARDARLKHIEEREGP